MGAVSEISASIPSTSSASVFAAFDDLRPRTEGQRVSSTPARFCICSALIAEQEDLISRPWSSDAAEAVLIAIKLHANGNESL